MTAALQAVADFAEWDSLPDVGWVQIREPYSSHWLCRTCAGDLTGLRLPFVAACPYCGRTLPWWSTVDAPTLTLPGWPWSLFRDTPCPRQGNGRGHRCGWQRTPRNLQPGVPTPMLRCRRVEHSDGRHDYGEQEA